MDKINKKFWEKLIAYFSLITEKLAVGYTDRYKDRQKGDLINFH
jgi:hypothetical protein